MLPQLQFPGLSAARRAFDFFRVVRQIFVTAVILLASESHGAPPGDGYLPGGDDSPWKWSDHYQQPSLPVHTGRWWPWQEKSHEPPLATVPVQQQIDAVKGNYADEVTLGGEYDARLLQDLSDYLASNRVIRKLVIGDFEINSRYTNGFHLVARALADNHTIEVVEFRTEVLRRDLVPLLTEGLARNTSVREIIFSGLIDLDDNEVVKAMAAAVARPGLQSLTVYAGDFLVQKSPQPLVCLADVLGKSTSLRSLILTSHGNGLSNEAMTALAEVLKTNKFITNLAFRKIPYINQKCQALLASALQINQTLTDLDFTGSSLQGDPRGREEPGVEPFELFQAIAASQSLRKVSFKKALGTYEMTVRVIEALVATRTIEDLNLEENNLFHATGWDKVSGALLKMLPKNGSLKKLRFGCRVLFEMHQLDTGKYDEIIKLVKSDRHPAPGSGGSASASAPASDGSPPAESASSEVPLSFEELLAKVASLQATVDQGARRAAQDRSTITRLGRQLRETDDERCACMQRHASLIYVRDELLAEQKKQRDELKSVRIREDQALRAVRDLEAEQVKTLRELEVAQRTLPDGALYCDPRALDACLADHENRHNLCMSCFATPVRPRIIKSADQHVRLVALCDRCLFGRSGDGAHTQESSIIGNEAGQLRTEQSFAVGAMPGGEIADVKIDIDGLAGLGVEEDEREHWRVFALLNGDGSYHPCATPDCKWGYYREGHDDNKCPKCGAENCPRCLAIHPGMDCFTHSMVNRCEESSMLSWWYPPDRFYGFSDDDSRVDESWDDYILRLNRACPRCARVYRFFEGCYALKCQNSRCPGYNARSRGYWFDFLTGMDVPRTSHSTGITHRFRFNTLEGRACRDEDHFAEVFETAAKLRRGESLDKDGHLGFIHKSYQLWRDKMFAYLRVYPEFEEKWRKDQEAERQAWARSRGLEPTSGSSLEPDNGPTMDTKGPI